MTDLMEALADAPAKISTVSASLAELSEEGGDMKSEFEAFDESVDDLIDHRDRLRSMKAEVDENKEVFTSAWEERLQSIQDEELRQRSVERRNAVVEEFAEVKKVADSAREEFEPWMQKVLDLRTYLESDLNPAGVASVADIMEDISGGSGSLNEKIQTVLAELDRISKAIAAAKPPPAEDEAQ
jgi:chromosome segregation ATPase